MPTCRTRCTRRTLLRSALSAGLGLAAGGVAGCATAQREPEPEELLARWITERPLVLLGEVHDHPGPHALRLAAFDTLLARGARPALVMEMFERQRQGDIDRLRAAQAPAARLVAEVGGGGWHWPFYAPFIERALAHGLPLVAANVGRTEARAVMRDGLAAHGFAAEVPAPLLATIVELVQASHCGMVDAPLAARMALAQVARDRAMASALVGHMDRGAVLLAGNGHVRTDIGVPRWLPPAARARTLAIGIVERGDATSAFDRRLVTAVHPRADPCVAMRSTAPPR